MNVLERAIADNTDQQTREKSEILSVLQETLGSVGEDEEILPGDRLIDFLLF